MDRSCWPRVMARPTSPRKSRSWPTRHYFAPVPSLEGLYCDGRDAVGRARQLDLDRDVNEYLDFAIPKTFAEPVTLRRLLTHTAGFEEVVKNLFVASANEMRPLREYLIGAMPARIRLDRFHRIPIARIGAWPVLGTGAQLGRTVRKIHCGPHPGTAAHGALDFRATAAAIARDGNVEGICRDGPGREEL